ncbi:MAG: oxidoreductase [Candidatus Parcubacteria bacterium]|nr:MAG: oxidoreductase [Candidatus Parcubacteria bacterium]GIW67691.1 MAG: oxidoreductase [Candidatus Parcubacteria bacterium]
MKVKLLSKREIAEGTMEFCFEKPEGLNFKAGQHFILTLINPPETDEKGNERVFSVVSSPDENKICFATRMRDSAFKRVLKNLSEGSEIELDGPYGQMVLPKDTNKTLVFIAGGIGITPFISMIRYAVKNNLHYKIYLFYSNRRPEDTAYLDELLEYDKQGKIKLIATMTQMENSSKPWSGERVYINEEMIKKYLGEEIGNTTFYVAGPPQMSQAMYELLNNMGVNEEKIKGEDFSGY